MRKTKYVDDEFDARLRRVVPNRGINRFVNQAIAEKLDTEERVRLEKNMQEGYIATRQVRAELNDEWAVTDVEGWPE